ncbi:hypothetical protein Salat_2921500 [Sesamum alatum]|uniref:Uncharacterized protein n=1 Tax=Sesamum alatum TaxID=300844 RepID=A0AAE2C8C2_9LAMI|nr:hypothetical protein Salat_2921500 [Sesamum alatum]
MSCMAVVVCAWGRKEEILIPLPSLVILASLPYFRPYSRSFQKYEILAIPDATVICLPEHRIPYERGWIPYRIPACLKSFLVVLYHLVSAKLRTVYVAPDLRNPLQIASHKIEQCDLADHRESKSSEV